MTESVAYVPRAGDMVVRTAKPLTLRLAELRTLMFFIVARPINVQTTLARRDIVRREAPRWRPDKAFARFVGDPASQRCEGPQ